jgi:hypothetical protein
MTRSLVARSAFRLLSIALACTAVVAGASRAQEPRSIAFGDSGKKVEFEPFFPDTTYAPDVPKPDTLLRQPLGTFTAHHSEILAALRAMADKSPRMTVVPFGRTHEGRELVYAVVGTPEHLANLERVRGDLAKLADPRGLAEADAERIVKGSPAVAWLGYSIHGDETSGSDASLAVTACD